MHALLERYQKTRSREMKKRQKPTRSLPEAMRLLSEKLPRNGSQPPACSHLPTGQQDPLQLDWWPRDLQNKPLVYIYRAIRDDFEEWLDEDPWTCLMLYVMGAANARRSFTSVIQILEHGVI